jgi:hypothetical protein
VARLAVAIFLLAWTSYALAATAFMQLGGVQKILGSGDSIQIGFRRAWSFWPGHVHVQDFVIVAQDNNVQFSIEIPNVEVHMKLLELTKRTFHATSVRGSGLVFRFRHRINPESLASAPWVSAYPPIPGMADPPLREASAPTPPVDEAHYKLWTIHLENVDVDAREVWAQMARFQGQAHVHGQFQLKPALHLWVGPPAELTFASGNVSVGPYDVFRDWRGTITALVDPFNVNTLEGMQVFRQISARVTVSAELAGLDVGSLFAPDLELADGSGAFDLDLGLEHGVVAADSSMLLRSHHVAMRAGDKSFNVFGSIALAAGGAEAYRATDPKLNVPSDAGHIALELPVASVWIGGDRYPPLELRGAAALVATTSLDVTKSWDLAGALVRFDKAELDDLRWIRPKSRPDNALGIDGGRGHASGFLSLTREQGLFASLSAQVEEGRFSWKASTWQANASAEFTTEKHAARDDAEREGKRLLAEAAADVRGAIKLRDVRFASGDHKVESWWADIDVSRARLDPAHNFDASARVEAKLQNGLPVLYLLTSDDDIPHIVPALLPLDNVMLGVDVDHHCRFTDVRIVQATGGPLAAEGRLQLERGETRGAVLVHTAPTAILSMGLELREQSSHTAPMVGQGWLAERLAPLGEVAQEKRRSFCPPSPVANR